MTTLAVTVYKKPQTPVLKPATNEQTAAFIRKNFAVAAFLRTLGCDRPLLAPAAEPTLSRSRTVYSNLSSCVGIGDHIYTALTAPTIVLWKRQAAKQGITSDKIYSKNEIVIAPYPEIRIIEDNQYIYTFGKSSIITYNASIGMGTKTDTPYSKKN